MKLLQILYPGLGGHSSVAFSLIEGDENKIMEHYLLGYGIENPSKNFISKTTELNVKFDSVLKSKGFGLKSLMDVYSYLKKVKPEFIISHSTSVVFVLFIYSFFHKIKWVMVEHQSNYAKSKKDWVYTLLIIILSPKIVYLTESYKKEIESRFKYLIQHKNIEIIPNGINITKFSPPSNKSVNEKLRLSMISRLTPLRDHKTLIYAINDISRSIQCELYIAGDGVTKNELVDLVKDLKLENNVKFLGVLNEEEIVNLLHNTDIYIHSSLAENQSTSLLQVMACKVPVIASDIPGINNLIEHKINGILFQVKNVQNLKLHILDLYENENLKKNIAENAYNQTIKNFDNRKLFQTYNNIWTN